MRALTLVAALIAAFPAAAQTQAEMNETACSAYADSDAALNGTYRSVVAALRSQPRRLSALRTAQRTWVSYRDQHVRSMCPDPSECGSIWPLQRCSALRHLTDARTELLGQEFLSN